MRIDAKARFEIGVNAREVHSVIQRQQHERNNQIPQYISKYQLKIIEIDSADIARYAHERNTRQGSTYHAKSHQHPVTVSITDKERIVVGITRSIPGYTQQQQKITDHEGEQYKWRHKLQ